MNAVQNAHLQMFAAVQVTCDAHTAAWSGLPLFADAYADFVALLPDTVAAGALQATSSKGTTLAKKALRNTLEAKLLQIAAALVGYALTNNNAQLAEDARTTPSDLHNVGAEKLIFRSEKLLKFTEPLADDALEPFGVSDEFITTAASDQDLFMESIGKPRHVIGESKRGTQELAVAIGGLNSILKLRMDPGAEVLKYTQAAFYSEYITAREIIDPGSSSSTTYEGTVAPSETKTIATLTYNASKNIMATTTGDANLRFSLNVTPGEPEANVLDLGGSGSTETRTMEELNANPAATILQVVNLNSAIGGSYTVVVG